MPNPDVYPPNPNPTPSPTPMPTAMLQIESITETLEGSTLTFVERVEAIDVSSDYISTCEPEVGGFFVLYSGGSTYFSPTLAASLFPQS